MYLVFLSPTALDAGNSYTQFCYMTLRTLYSTMSSAHRTPARSPQVITHATQNLPVTSLLDISHIPLTFFRPPSNLLEYTRCATSPSPSRRSPEQGRSGNGQLQPIVDTEISGALVGSSSPVRDDLGAPNKLFSDNQKSKETQAPISRLRHRWVSLTC
jgi:hypothetical protein